MADITITKINDVWMKVLCVETYMELDIVDEFSFKIPNAQYDPRVKRGVWDGIKKLFNRKSKRMHVGLLYALLGFCDRKGYSVNVDSVLAPNEETLDDEDLDELIKFINPHSNGVPIEPYDYQLEAVKHMLNMERTACLAATSAGKSLMMYLVIRIYQLMDEFKDKRIFICVPSVSLVEQLYADFADYANYTGSNWNVNQYVQRISGDYSKHVDSPIVITTWQSMNKLPSWIYEDMGAIFIDETHTASAKVLGGILEQATTTPIRHGLTGTLDGCECNELVIQGLLGPAKRIVTAKETIDAGRASDIEVRMSVLKHPQISRQKLATEKANLPSNKRYHEEVEFLNGSRERREFIKLMVDSMPGNSLVLFDRVDGYGRELYEEYKEMHDNTFLIVGEVSSSEREEIRISMEDHENATIFGSFGTMQQGISIKKLHNMFIVSSSKSKIRVLQSIGRMMRLHSSKDRARIFDLVDDLTFDDTPNYCMSHAGVRLGFYSNEGFNIEFDEYQLPPPPNGGTL